MTDGYIQPDDDEIGELLTPREYINITINEFDVTSIADMYHISWSLAYERMEEWAKHIQDTMSGYVMEQVESVIRHGQP